LIRINAGRESLASAVRSGVNVASSAARSRAEAPSERPSRDLPAGPPSCASESEFLIRLGERVRVVRVLKAMSRRQLARQTGISERYLAQIEAGKANVSIVLLLRIIHAVRRN
jgi:XRE family aerobic/anaerobic benzoate catabolism transcriptional regulator